MLNFEKHLIDEQRRLLGPHGLRSDVRLKGWVLCDADGLCLVALRETAAYFYENRLLFSVPWPADIC